MVRNHRDLILWDTKRPPAFSNEEMMFEARRKVERQIVIYRARKRGNDSTKVEGGRMLGEYCCAGCYIPSIGCEPTCTSHLFEPEGPEHFAGRFLLCRRNSAGLSPAPFDAVNYKAE